LIQFLMRLVS